MSVQQARAHLFRLAGLLEPLGGAVRPWFTPVMRSVRLQDGLPRVLPGADDPMRIRAAARHQLLTFAVTDRPREAFSDRV